MTATNQREMKKKITTTRKQQHRTTDKSKGGTKDIVKKWKLTDFVVY